MPTALLPNGQMTYVDHNLDVSVSFPDRAITSAVEHKLLEALATDNRQLFVRVQGGGGYGQWCFWIQWGNGSNVVRTKPVCLAEDEHTPEAILARVQSELSFLGTDGESVALRQSFPKASAGRDPAPPNARGTSADLGAGRKSVALRSSSKARSNEIH